MTQSNPGIPFSHCTLLKCNYTPPRCMTWMMSCHDTCISIMAMQHLVHHQLHELQCSLPVTSCVVWNPYIIGTWYSLRRPAVIVHSWITELGKQSQQLLEKRQWRDIHFTRDSSSSVSCYAGARITWYNNPARQKMAAARVFGRLPSSLRTLVMLRTVELFTKCYMLFYTDPTVHHLYSVG